MKRLLFLLGTCVLIWPSLAAASATPSSKGTARAENVLKGALAALHRQGRVQVDGTTTTRTKATATYRLRYQSGGREELVIRQGGQVAGRGGLTVHYILIGKSAYTFASSRWYRIRGAPPDASDVLALNTSSAPCCTGESVRAGERVTYKGTGTWHGNPVDKIGFVGASATGASRGTIYISRRTHLPLGYYSAAAQGAAGRFSITYGAHFDISAPKT